MPDNLKETIKLVCSLIWLAAMWAIVKIDNAYRDVWKTETDKEE